MLEILRRAWRLGDEVLGINARNLELIYPLNPRRCFPLVDDKLLAKELLSAGGIPTPRTLAVFECFGDVKRLEPLVRDLDGFAVKPTRSSGGRGILIARRAGGGRFAVAGHALPIEPAEIGEHVLRVLSGLSTPSQLTERVFLEELLEPDDLLGGIAGGGVPDVRILLLRGRPLMAMLRLPTRGSGGRANLHQGALGLGVDLELGRTSGVFQRSGASASHPDTGLPLEGIEIPRWHEMLDMSIAASACFGLGYVGVDIVLDRRHGPLVIELNARPGLSIQLANRAGLWARLRETGRHG